MVDHVQETGPLPDDDVFSAGLSERTSKLLRRAKSVTRAEEIVKAETKIRRAQPDKPCHKPRDSLFSWSSQFRDFTGLVNWGFLLLLIGGLRLMLENLIKYGVRVDPIQWLILLNGGTSEMQDEYPSVVLFLVLNIPILLTFWVERLLSQDKITWTSARIFHVVNLLLLVILPVVAINALGPIFGLVGASCVCAAYTITFLKLWSYIQVNSWCRNDLVRSKKLARKRCLSVTQSAYTAKQQVVGTETLVHYPENLSVKDLYYFMVLPTLCYELNFPRTSRIRKRFLIKRVLETLIGFQVMLALVQQWMIPSVRNSLVAISKMEAMTAMERLLKLAVPNHLIWLIGFYLLFHSFLNLISEILRFADREFYLDWWNSKNVEVFWRTWNMPIHRWALRHLYMPLLGKGYSKLTAASAVFFLSAFFHEYLVSVPLRMWKLWAFAGMMAQVPLTLVSHMVDKKLGAPWGNVIVWLSLILGQPLCIMVYYHDYVITHFKESL